MSDLSGLGRVARVRSALAPLFVGTAGTISTLLFFGLFSSVTEGIGLNLLALYVYLLTKGGGSAEYAAQQLGTVGTFLLNLLGQNEILMGVVIVPIVMAGSFLSSLYEISAARLANLIARRARTALFERAVRLDFAHARPDSKGYLLDALEYEVVYVPKAALLMTASLHHLITIGVYIVFIATISWQTAAIMMLAAIPLVLSLPLPMRWLGGVGRLVSQRNARAMGFAVAALTGIRAIRLFAAEGSWSRRFEALSTSLADAEMRREIARAVIRPVRAFVLLIAVMVILLGAQRAGVVSASLLIMLALAARLYPSVSAVESIVTQLLGDFPALEIVADVLISPSADLGSAEKRIPRDRFEELTFESVEFSYPTATRTSIADASFQIRAGETVLVNGHSGSGKTTMVNLLGLLIRPTRGQIYVNGAPLSAISRIDWLSRLGFAGQDVELLEDTIVENVRMNRGLVSEDDIRTALAVAAVDEFAAELPRGLQTVVGEGGQQLSGGQRQRVALARALAARPEVLIIDEGTNAVDVGAEIHFIVQLKKHYPKMTLVFITHRNSSQEFDRILSFDQGSVTQLISNPARV